MTFAPLRWEEDLERIPGKILGVVEIAQDVTEDYKTIIGFKILVVFICTVLWGSCS